MTIVSLLDPHAADSIALIEGERTTTYGELRQLVAETRAGLRAHGLQPGDRVGIYCESTRSSVVALLGAVSAGFVAVPLNPMSPQRELERELEAVQAAILLGAAEGTVSSGIATASPAGTIIPGVDPLPTGDLVDPVVLAPDDLAVMLFTSGTAGDPKPAMLSDDNLSFVQQAIINHPASDVDAATVHLAMLPLAHVYGLNISLMTTLRAGGKVVLATKFSPVLASELIPKHGVTHFAGVPPMWRAFLGADVPRDIFSGLRRLTSGASALPRELFDEFKERFDIELSEGYGLTETASGVSAALGGNIRATSVGLPLPGIEVAIVDYDGNPAPTDDSGIIKIRGRNVFLGYWEDEEATKQVLDADGWLNTGDVGVMSEDGFLFLVDRVKDLIIVAGFNVYPFEVEQVVASHAAIKESVVVGALDDRRGERIIAYATLNEGKQAPTLDELVEHCRDELARYKCPSELRIVETLPIAPTGKPIRRELT